MTPRANQTRLSRLATLLSALTLTLFAFSAATGSSAAQESAALYQATAIVTGTDMRQRPKGFAEALLEVLVKLSGASRLRADPAAIALSKQAEGLVDSYTYVDPRAGLLHHDDQGTYDRSYELTVRFNRAKVEAALIKLGASVWRGPRPVLFPMILVRNREPTPFLLSAENPRGAELRETLARIAAEHGLGVRFPSEANFAESGVTLLGFPTPLNKADPSLLRVTGTLSWNVQAIGWIGTWRAARQETEHGWEIKGVSFDQAFTDLLRGAALLASGAGAP